ncbi:MAG TPA: hypothetical protein VK150_02530 [Geothrix sp.]|nr:hypothetical protein [Geothrix sp.]
MGYIVLANSTRVILPLRVRLEAPDRIPRLWGILVSQAKASGHCLQSFIEMGEPGLPRPFLGERWRYEWRSDGDGMLACWLGFPNVFFSGGIDPVARISVEAMGRFGTGGGMLRSLSRIHITVKNGIKPSPGPGAAKWVPDDSPRPFPA